MKQKKQTNNQVMRLRHKKVLVIFTKRLGDRCIFQSIKKGSIILPKNCFIEDKTLVIFDDVTPLGVMYTRDLVDVLAQNNDSVIVYNAQDLATKVARILPEADITLLDGGGVLAYLFLKSAGYKGRLKEIVRVDRKYVDGKPFCEIVRPAMQQSCVLLDDIIASGQTIATVLSATNLKMNVACLLASANIPQGRGNYRERQGSTLRDVKKLYCAQFVNGVRRRKDLQEKPAILSLRYLLTKAVDAQDYTKSYLVKKFGGQENANRILSLVKEINRAPIDLLRGDPYKFLIKNGVEVKL